MSNNFPRAVIILGGGTAGWLAAAYLDRIYNKPGQTRLPITVVESADIGRIGVGEATIPSLRDTLAFLGIYEADFMSRTGATLKQGVRFQDWGAIGESYFHPFEALMGRAGPTAGAAWLGRKKRGVAGKYSDESCAQGQLAEAGKSPKRMLDDDYQAHFPYAYHIDAERFGDLLRDVALSRGCVRVEGEVERVELDAAGDVAALLLKSGAQVAGDFFIDCSGFAAVILGGALKTPFVSFSEHLLCDRAVAIQSPYEGAVSIPPMTRTTALSAGWMWRIGLRAREGTGYVYSSAFLSPEEAESELRRAAGLPDHLKARHLTMRVGRSETCWVRNCVGIGLASGFIEPLESTGIYFIEEALKLLVRYFPLSGENPAARNAFNDSMMRRYEEVRDFIAAHYCLSRRDDTPFWREVRKPEHIPEGLKRKLEIWSDRAPSYEDITDATALFRHSSWEHIIYGLNWTPQEAMDNALSWTGPVDDYFHSVQGAVAHASADLPSHDVWLEGVPFKP